MPRKRNISALNEKSSSLTPKQLQLFAGRFTGLNLSRKIRNMSAPIVVLMT